MRQTDIYQRIIDVLASRKRVLITTHVRPDGDALGTTAALALGLTKANIAAEVLLLSHLPRKYSFVYEENKIVYQDVERGWPGEGSGFRVQGSEKTSSLNPEPRNLNPFFDRFDALLVADTGTWSQLPGLREQM